MSGIIPSEIEALRAQLADIKANPAEEDFPGQNNEYRRSIIVTACIDSVNQLISEGSDGSVEESEYLYAEVALKLVSMVHNSHQSKLLRYDLANR